MQAHARSTRTHRDNGTAAAAASATAAAVGGDAEMEGEEESKSGAAERNDGRTSAAAAVAASITVASLKRNSSALTAAAATPSSTAAAPLPLRTLSRVGVVGVGGEGAESAGTASRKKARGENGSAMAAAAANADGALPAAAAAAAASSAVPPLVVGGGSSLLARLNSTAVATNGNGFMARPPPIPFNLALGARTPTTPADEDMPAAALLDGLGAAGDGAQPDEDDGLEDDDNWFQMLDAGTSSPAMGAQTPLVVIHPIEAVVDDGTATAGAAPAAAAAAPASAAAAAASSSAAAAAAASDLEARRGWASVQLPHPPLDWNLHGKIRFTSWQPFTWLEKRDVQDEAEGLAAYVRASSINPKCDCRFLQEMHHALLYSQFPAPPFSRHPHPLAAQWQAASTTAEQQQSHAEKVTVQTVNKMWIQWEDSFRSLYYRLRLHPADSSSHLSHFYSVHRVPVPFTVLWLSSCPEAVQPLPALQLARARETNSLQAQDLNAACEPAAVLSRSNKPLRQLLQKHGVSYLMPNTDRAGKDFDADAAVTSFTAAAASSSAAAAALPANAISGDDTDEQVRQRIQQRKDEQQERDEDLTAASVLVVKGRKDVHALYDFILNADRRDPSSMPLLLASTIFLNSTTQALNIVRVGVQHRGNRIQPDMNPPPLPAPTTVKKKAASASAAASAASAAAAPSSSGSFHGLFTLDITGPILPASALRLMHLLAKMQGGAFQAVLSSDEFPGPFLNCVEGLPQMSRIGSGTGGDAAAVAAAAGDERAANRRGAGRVPPHPLCTPLCLQPELQSKRAALVQGKKPVRSIGALKRVRFVDGEFSVDLL